MRYLRIEKGRGEFCLVPDEWKAIDTISSDELLVLMNHAIDDDFEMDEYISGSISNPAHQIIYQNIYAKFTDLLENKPRFKDDIELLYKPAFDKYSKEERTS